MFNVLVVDGPYIYTDEGLLTLTRGKSGQAPDDPEPASIDTWLLARDAFAALPVAVELAEELVRCADRGSGREISDVTRREMEPLRKLAETFLTRAGLR